MPKTDAVALIVDNYPEQRHPDQQFVQKLKKDALARVRRLDDGPYGELQDQIVIACVDVAAAFEGRLFVGLRPNEPFKGGIGFFGGKIKNGESTRDTVQRHLRTSLQIDLEPNQRIRVVRTDPQLWSRRAQPPEDHGCHMMGMNVFIVLTKAQFEAANPRGDITKWWWLTPEEIIAHEGMQYSHVLTMQDILADRFQS